MRNFCVTFKPIFALFCLVLQYEKQKEKHENPFNYRKFVLFYFGADEGI